MADLMLSVVSNRVEDFLVEQKMLLATIVPVDAFSERNLHVVKVS